MDIPLAGSAAVDETAPTIGVIDGFSAARGMPVVGADGEQVGLLKDMDALTILVDRPLRRDVYVPHTALQGVRDNRIVLTIPAHDVDGMGWPHPDLFS